MKKIRTILATLLFLFFSIAASADAWYVCFGSFKMEENAIQLQRDLEKQDIYTFVIAQEGKTGTEYKVLATQEDGKVNTAYYIMAQEHRSTLSQIAKTLGITSLTLCEADQTKAVSPATKNTVTHKEEKNDDIQTDPIILTQNSESTQLSEQTPYTVKVNSYRDESLAKHESERLRELGIDSYVLGHYDDENFLSFNLYAGSFKNKEDAEQLEEDLSKLGINVDGTTTYHEIKEDIESYNEIVKESNITFDTGATQVPEVFSEAVVDCISAFPVNRDYQIEKIEIIDMDNIKKNNWYIPGNSFFAGIDSGFESFIIHAGSYATYKDNLYHKTVQVIVLEVEGKYESAVDEYFNSFYDSLSQDDDTFSSWTMKSGDEIFDCKYSKQGEFIGINRNKNLLLMMDTEGFTSEQLAQFVKNSYSDESLLIYPQIRTNLFILPSNERANRDFVYYQLYKVDDSYARSKGYSSWSIPIVGHWNADARFILNNEELTLGFFNLDYNRNAQNTYDMFQKEKQEVSQTENNHSEKVNGNDGWFLKNYFTQELSFCKDAYIIAIDSESYSDLNLEDFMKCALDLKIW